MKNVKTRSWNGVLMNGSLAAALSSWQPVNTDVVIENKDLIYC